LCISDQGYTRCSGGCKWRRGEGYQPTPPQSG
jgi:hypothetical protein